MQNINIVGRIVKVNTIDTNIVDNNGNIKKKAFITIADNDTHRDKDGNKIADFINCQWIMPNNFNLIKGQLIGVTLVMKTIKKEIDGVNRYENVLDVVGLNSYNRPSVKEDR